MCGLVGELDLNGRAPIGAARLHAANDLMDHRGPDDAGSYFAPGIGLAMRRLSIVDVEHGRQPMTNARGTIRAVCNGEIYNHRELRRELEGRGVRFKTQSDCEVLPHGYEAWGRDGLLQRLRGMFAFAIWDEEQRALLLARDRMGIKPLYFSEHGGFLRFASEIRPLLSLTPIPRRVDPAALALYMRIGFVTSPHTMLEGIRRLAPAHYLWVKNGRVSVDEYWSLSYEPTNSDSAEAIVEQFRSLLQRTIDEHLMSDVPVGALLSGGLDSSATAAFVTRTLGRDLDTITVAFPDSRLDESQLAEATARALGTRHRTIRFTGGMLDDYPSVIRAQEEPFARPTNAASSHLFGECRKLGLKVVITGEGADELLGGYSWHGAGRIGRLTRHVPWRMQRVVERSKPLRIFASRALSLARRARGSLVEEHERFERDIRIGNRAVGEALLSPGFADIPAADAIVDGWSSWLDGHEDEPEFGKRLWLQSRTRMADYINLGLDRQSMRHSVEARPPFQDHALWSFTAPIPSALKMRNGIEKYLLREASRGIVPEPARTRRKFALRVPFEQWLAGERLADWAETALSPQALERHGLFAPAAVAALRREVRAGNRRDQTLLAAVLHLQAWADFFL